MRSKEAVNHRIASGTIRMSRRFFSKESLKAGSYLRLLLGLDGGYSKKVKGIHQEKDEVVVTYSNDDIVFVPDDVRGFAKHLKEVYGQDLHGRITFTMAYGHVSFIEIHVDFD